MTDTISMYYYKTSFNFLTEHYHIAIDAINGAVGGLTALVLRKVHPNSPFKHRTGTGDPSSKSDVVVVAALL